ncbi:MAG: hypothetical protein M3Y82_13975 [Verrucomicrobiota bacterium]|nr:hypothetical protein [Verrucomicrobiota bacterium]
MAFPGLGSLMAGRKVGYAQMALMLLGFFCAVGYIGWFTYREFHFVMDYAADSKKHEATKFSFWWIGAGGLGLCSAVWVWSLCTSMEIINSVPKNTPLKIPPII